MALNDTDPSTADRNVRRAELLISVLLRTGVVVSLLIVLAGTILSFAHHGDYLNSPDGLRHVTGKEAEFPHTVKTVIAEIRQGRGRAVVVLGLLLLIATPVLRVAVSIVGFVYEKDWFFVATTSVVLALLLLSFFLGKAGG